jgi:leader peptidase (prepilin peptidase) / N-methyltransferase
MFAPDASARQQWAVALAFLLVLGVLTVPALLHVRDHPRLVLALVLAPTLAALSAIDLQQHRLPDLLTGPLTVVGLLASAWMGVQPPWWPVFSAALGFGLLAGLAYAYRALRGRTGMGLGDAKLLAAAGAWVGAEGLPAVLLWATGPALLCVLLAYWRGQTMSATTRLPFGPFLAIATWLVWLYGPL